MRFRWFCLCEGLKGHPREIPPRDPDRARGPAPKRGRRMRRMRRKRRRRRRRRRGEEAEEATHQGFHQILSRRIRFFLFSNDFSILYSLNANSSHFSLEKIKKNSFMTILQYSCSCNILNSIIEGTASEEGREGQSKTEMDCWTTKDGRYRLHQQ